MKKIKLLVLVFFLGAFASLNAQDKSKIIPLGTKENFVASLNSHHQQSAKAGAKSPNNKEKMDIRLPNGSTISITIDLKKQTGQKEFFYGKVKDKSARFNIALSPDILEGSIVFEAEAIAYKIYTDDSKNVLIEEVNAGELICIDYDVPDPHQSNIETPEPAVMALPPGLDVKNLQSFPGVNAVALLDFDGHIVPPGAWSSQTINAAASPMTAEQIYAAWQVTSEDFRPFNINITTNESVYNAAPANSRMRVIITPTKDFYPQNVGGVALRSSFRRGDDTPCWAFIHTGRNTGEVISHELGHTVGLAHDGTTTGNDYYTGLNGWAPIMGVGYSETIVQWSKGEYQDANNLEDDLSVMVNGGYGFGYRTDAVGNSISTAASLSISSNGDITPTLNSGIIERATDIDVFKFVLDKPARVQVKAIYPVSQTNLGVLLKLMDATGKLIIASDPLDLLSASLDRNLSAGTYFISVDGIGKGSPLTYYSDYGSLGEYALSGTITGLTFENLALNKPTYSSSVENAGTPSNYAVDGNTATRWSSQFSNPQWLTVDLGLVYNIDRVKITWEGAYGKSYKIQISNTNNGSDWKDIKTVTGNTTLINDWTALASYGQYVRIYGIERGTTFGYSILELEVYSGASKNNSPLVQITSPQHGGIYSERSTIVLAASASDYGGAVSKVEFFNGFTKVGEDITAPYTHTYGTFAIGTYTLRAVATDNEGLTSGTSVTIQIIQHVNKAPVVRLTSPVEGNSVNTGESFVFRAEASDVDGSISKVEFKVNGKLLATDYDAPYSATYSPTIAAGPTGVTAVAFDNEGLSTVSDNVILYVYQGNIFPTVSIKSPQNGATFTAPVQITIQADASDADGTVALVEFFRGSVKIGQATSGYNFTWTNVAAGTYNLTARATDNAGAQTVSSVVTIQVNAVVKQNLALNKVATSSTNENAGVTPNYAVDGNTATRWSSAFSDPQWITIDLGRTYSIEQVKITWEGAYGGNYRIQTSNTNNGTDWVDIKTVTGNTALINNWTGLSGTGRYIRVYGTVRGTVFGYSIYELEVYGEINNPPTVSLTTPLEGASVNIGQSIILKANASDSDGSIARVEFRANNILVATDNTAPYEVTFSPTMAGPTGIKATAFDNKGLNTVSENRIIYVFEGTSNVPLINKYAYSSSNESEATPAAYAVDGNTSTRWSSQFSDDQWLTIDLGQVYPINRVKIIWEGAYGKDYQIQTSTTNNGTDWITIKTVAGNTALLNDWTGLSGSGRYIRMYGTARGTAYGYSIFEMEAYGSPSATIASNERPMEEENSILSHEISSYPNPVEDELNLSGVEVDAIIVVYDLMGNEQLRLNGNPVNGITTIDVRSLKTGIYSLRVSGNNPAILKFVKQ